MTRILQERLPVAPWTAAHTMRLPGTTPIAPQDWLLRDDAFAAQMALRDALLATRPAAVHAVLPEAEAAARELLDGVLAALGRDPGYGFGDGRIVRPDGVAVPADGPPLATAGRLVQEDFCLLQKADGEPEHRLTGAVLCFPSNWTLAEKLGRPLSRIHRPVPSYDADVARRVQRLFDLVRPEAPLMRANLLPYGVPDLFNPRVEGDRERPAAGAARFVRVERQVILRLPRTGAVVFSIHTFMVEPRALTEAQRAALEDARPGVFEGV